MRLLISSAVSVILFIFIATGFAPAGPAVSVGANMTEISSPRLEIDGAKPSGVLPFDKSTSKEGDKKTKETLTDNPMKSLGSPAIGKSSAFTGFVLSIVLGVVGSISGLLIGVALIRYVGVFCGVDLFKNP